MSVLCILHFLKINLFFFRKKLSGIFYIRNLSVLNLSEFYVQNSSGMLIRKLSIFFYIQDMSGLYVQILDIKNFQILDLIIFWNNFRTYLTFSVRYPDVFDTYSGHPFFIGIVLLYLNKISKNFDIFNSVHSFKIKCLK